MRTAMVSGTRAGSASQWDGRGQRPGQDRAAGGRCTRIGDRRKLERLDWVTALKAPPPPSWPPTAAAERSWPKWTCISQIDEPAEIEPTERLFVDLTIPANALRLV